MRLCIVFVAAVHIMYHTMRQVEHDAIRRLSALGPFLLPPIHRFQAAAVGDTIYIHHHRCSDHILALEVAAEGGPRLSKV